MSKHHAAEEDPQISEMSWIQGLAKPAESAPVDQLPFYESLVARPPRHAGPDDEPLNRASDTTRTGPMRRISAEQVDTLIGMLDAVPGIPDTVALPAPESTTSTAPEVVTAETGNEETAGITDPETGDTPTFDTATSGVVRVSAVEVPGVTDMPRRQLVRPARAALRKPILLGAAATLCLLTVGGGTVTAKDKTMAIVLERQAPASTLSSFAAGAPASVDLPSGDQLAIPGAKALGRLGFLAARPAPQANRSRPILIAGQSAAAPALHTVSLTVGGGSAASATSSAKTVGQFLTERKITFGRLDTVVPAAGTPLSDGLVITVNRVVVRVVSTTVVVPEPAPTTVNDPTIVKGTSTVTRAGTPGSEVVTYQLTTVNGRQVAKRETGSRTVAAPVGRVTHVGTKTTFTYVGDEVFTNDTSFGVNWDGLAMCESTHNPRAINANPSAGLPTYGLFQFDLPTWASVGGSGNPIDASPEEQLMRAKLLFQSRGLDPWACRDAAH